jgi:hypothetical protein
MNMLRRALETGAALVVLLTVGTLMPTAAQGQDVELDRDRITQFAKAHMGLNDARDEFHGKVGRVHDEVGRTQAREEMIAQVAQILEGQELTQEQYDEITLIISLDADIRAMFEEVTLELAETGTSTR